MSVARILLLAAIRGYKRHVSPHKGYGCAYRLHAGGCSCSTLGQRAISRHGVWRGLGVLRLRLAQCRLVAEEVRARRAMPRFAQAGSVDCEVPCDASCGDGSACGSSDAGATNGACESLPCCDCGNGAGDGGGCGWSGLQRATDVPPRRRRRRGEPVAGHPVESSPQDKGPADE